MACWLSQPLLPQRRESWKDLLTAMLTQHLDQHMGQACKNALVHHARSLSLWELCHAGCCRRWGHRSAQLLLQTLWLPDCCHGCVLSSGQWNPRKMPTLRAAAASGMQAHAVAFRFVQLLAKALLQRCKTTFQIEWRKHNSKTEEQYCDRNSWGPEGLGDGASGA